LAAILSAVARRPFVTDVGSDLDAAFAFAGFLSDLDGTNLSLELFRRSFEPSGSSIWLPFPFTTRSERFELFFLGGDFFVAVFLRVVLVCRFVFVAMLLLSRSHEKYLYRMTNYRRKGDEDAILPE
jgi:hypothetical protein